MVAVSKPCGTGAWNLISVVRHLASVYPEKPAREVSINKHCPPSSPWHLSLLAESQKPVLERKQDGIWFPCCPHSHGRRNRASFCAPEPARCGIGFQQAGRRRLQYLTACAVYAASLSGTETQSGKFATGFMYDVTTSRFTNVDSARFISLLKRRI